MSFLVACLTHLGLEDAPGKIANILIDFFKRKVYNMDVVKSQPLKTGFK